MIFVTGDTHYPIDGGKLLFRRENFPVPALCREDYVIVLGDFGLFWAKRAPKNGRNMRRVRELPYTLLFVDGNHENFDWLEEFPVVEKFGGKVHRCGENILHLMRGEIYTIQDKRFFVCGGAASHDREFRQTRISWWPQENISEAEKRNALQHLDAAGDVDFILTHTCPNSITQEMFGATPIYDVTGEFLNIVNERLPETPWYFGHWHEERDLGRFHCLYNSIRRIV